MPDGTPILDSSFKETQSRNNFFAVLDSYINTQPDQVRRGREFGYIPGAASFYYPEQSFEIAINSLTDNVGFFGYLEQHGIPDITEEGLYRFINDLNTFLVTRGVSGIRIVPVDPVEGEPAYVNAVVNGEEVEIFNNLPPDYTGTNNTYTAHYVDTVEDNDGNTIELKYNYSQRTRNEPSTILLNKNMIKENPVAVIIALAHEIGHEEEETHKSDVVIDSETVNNVSPSTEAYSSLFGIKMSKYLFDRDPKMEFIEQAARHARLYNHVIFGTAKGKK